MIDEGFAVFGTVMGVHRKAGPLVHQKNVFIFVDNVQLGRCHSQIGIVLPGLVEKFVVDIKLEYITGFQTGVPVNALAVALDPLDADVFLSQRGGEQGNCLGKKPVQPLAGIVGTDGKFFHPRFPMAFSKCRLVCSMNSRAGL